MVNNFFLLLLVIFFSSCKAQDQKELWWFQNSHNLKYEESYKYLYSDIENGVLKQQIIEFIQKYIIANSKKNKDEIAIEVSSVFSKEKKEKIYNITYISNYYNFLPYKMNINQIAELKGRVIFIIDENLKDFKIKRNIIFGLLRDRHPKITKVNNLSYYKDGTFTENWIVEHKVPNWKIVIRNKKIISKEITFE